MIESIQNFAASFPDWLQWVGVMLASAIPFVESYFGAVIGVAIGLHPVIAILVAVIGNVVSMLIFVYGAGAIRDKATKNKEVEEKPKRQRLKRMFDKFGVPGVSLLGQTLLPSQITSSAMVGFGANRNVVALWQVISIILWGVLFGVLATLGIELALR
ncbi:MULTISPECIES: hypothetical protein [unclassified Brevibacterium]|uniref:hypothetical protein n=1 Tax=unclassified Brevibacterium TaxID=2614124 RepID=UPI0010924BAD|nr:hypothetical protein [Brevibacterium sp. S22]TGD28479.1 hypothetical protein EB835_17360 [Brevibacterium sp. S22]